MITQEHLSVHAIVKVSCYERGKHQTKQNAEGQMWEYGFCPECFSMNLFESDYY